MDCQTYEFKRQHIETVEPIHIDHRPQVLYDTIHRQNEIKKTCAKKTYKKIIECLFLSGLSYVMWNILRGNEENIRIETFSHLQWLSSQHPPDKSEVRCSFQSNSTQHTHCIWCDTTN